ILTKNGLVSVFVISPTMIFLVAAAGLAAAVGAAAAGAAGAAVGAAGAAGAHALAPSTAATIRGTLWRPIKLHRALFIANNPRQCNAVPRQGDSLSSAEVECH